MCNKNGAVVFAVVSLVAAIFACFPVGYEINTRILGSNNVGMFSFESFMLGSVIMLTFWCALVSAVAGCCRNDYAENNYEPI